MLWRHLAGIGPKRLARLLSRNRDRVAEEHEELMGRVTKPAGPEEDPKVVKVAGLNEFHRRTHPWHCTTDTD